VNTVGADGLARRRCQGEEQGTDSSHAQPADAVTVPASFRAMPRWWREGTAWLDSLPRLVAQQCRAWGLTVDGAAAHGSNALVIPVRRGGRPFALRLSPPSDGVAGHVAALRYWDGRGTVRLVACDPTANALLLERLDAGRSLAGEPLATAVPLIARLLRATAVRPPPRAMSTAAIVHRRIPELRRAWPVLGAPGGPRLLRAVLAAARSIPALAHPTAVNGDLHYAQVLAGARAPWLVVDPVLLSGDIGYAVAELLWTRLDEMPAAADIRRWLAVIAREAGLDPETARNWALFRAADYLAWGLRHGLTADPARCLRVLQALA
jgi:streptomycin 6-kinase